MAFPDNRMQNRLKQQVAPQPAQQRQTLPYQPPQVRQAQTDGGKQPFQNPGMQQYQPPPVRQQPQALPPAQSQVWQPPASMQPPQQAPPPAYHPPPQQGFNPTTDGAMPNWQPPSQPVGPPPGQNTAGPYQVGPSNPYAGNPNYDPNTGQLIGPGDDRYQWQNAQGQTQTGAVIPPGMGGDQGTYDAWQAANQGQNWQQQSPVVSAPAQQTPGYWTPEQMQNAQPMPMPQGPNPPQMGRIPAGWQPPQQTGPYMTDQFPQGQGPQQAPPPQAQPMQQYQGQGGGNNFNTLFNQYQQAQGNGFGDRFLRNHPKFADRYAAGNTPRNLGRDNRGGGNPLGQTPNPVGGGGVADATDNALAAAGVTPSGQPNNPPPTLGLPNSPEFMEGMRHLEDQLSATLMQIGIQRDEIPKMVELVKQRMATDQGLEYSQIDENANARGIYNSGIRRQDQERSDIPRQRQWQDFMFDINSRYGDLAQQEAQAKSDYWRARDEGLLDLAGNYADDMPSSIYQGNGGYDTPYEDEDYGGVGSPPQTPGSKPPSYTGPGRGRRRGKKKQQGPKNQGQGKKKSRRRGKKNG